MAQIMNFFVMKMQSGQWMELGNPWKRFAYLHLKSLSINLVSTINGFFPFIWTFASHRFNIRSIVIQTCKYIKKTIPTEFTPKRTSQDSNGFYTNSMQTFLDTFMKIKEITIY